MKGTYPSHGTDVQEQFYNYLSGWSDRQVIIIENVSPPTSIANRDSTIFFTKNAAIGRYGLFPP
jgi:hypothetical protein